MNGDPRNSGQTLAQEISKRGDTSFNSMQIPTYSILDSNTKANIIANIVRGIGDIL